jgi:hypothetical protein
MIMNGIGAVLTEQGNYAEAEKIVRKTLDLGVEVLGKGHPDTLMIVNRIRCCPHHARELSGGGEDISRSFRFKGGGSEKGVSRHADQCKSPGLRLWRSSKAHADGNRGQAFGLASVKREESEKTIEWRQMLQIILARSYPAAKLKHMSSGKGPSTHRKCYGQHGICSSLLPEVCRGQYDTSRNVGRE